MRIKTINENYFIDEYGNIYSRPRSKTIGGIVQPKLNKYGYLVVALCTNSKKKYYLLSRLIANAFIPNPENKPEVNHKDGNKLNNSINNLEWCTSSENVQHSWDTGLRNKKSITGEKYIYKSEKGKRYRVRFKRNKIEYVVGTFPTLGEAIVARDNWIKNN